MNHSIHSVSQDYYKIQSIPHLKYHINRVQQQLTILLKPNQIFIIFNQSNAMFEVLMHEKSWPYYQCYMNLS